MLWYPSLSQGNVWVRFGGWLSSTGNATTNAYSGSGISQFDCYQPLSYYMNPNTVCNSPTNTRKLPWFISGE